jgi:AraC-like DNA-binding protein
MINLVRIPRPPLGTFVEALWYCENPEPPGHRRERMMPTGGMGLIINLRADVLHGYDRRRRECVPQRGSIVVGPRAEYSVLDTSDQAHLIGVIFKPGGARAFLRPPAEEFEESEVNLDDVWRRGEVEQVRERLLEADDSDAQFDVLEQILLDRIRDARTAHPAVCYAAAEFRRGPLARPVGEVTGQVGLSPRRFAQLFREQVGLTPKRFSRVQRFQHVLRRVHSGDLLGRRGAGIGIFRSIPLHPRLSGVLGN